MIRIREYAENDVEELLALIRHLQGFEAALFDRMKPVSEIGPWYIEVLKKQCADKAGAILVAEEDGSLLGYATILTEADEDGSYDEVHYLYGYVGDLGVRPEDRGKGVGKLLLDECENRARQAGRKWLRIGVLANNVRARFVYERFGFAPHHVTMEKLLA